jgi:DNA (cytosine-5)-methyltransferase 1
MQNSGKPTVVDLFCGCGGLSEGFKQAGFEILLGVDNNTWAIKTYNKHNNDRGRIANVEEIDLDYLFRETEGRQIDVMVGGPPCQAFSSIAVAKWRSIGLPGTMDHPLNKLYEEFLRLVKDVRPKFFIIENVERMFKIKEGIVRKVIEYAIGEEYVISFYSENMADFGIPQHRKRGIVIGNRMGEKIQLLLGRIPIRMPVKNHM